jgi:hypothetical protein
MKRITFIIAVFGVLAVAALSSQTGTASASNNKEVALVEFTQTVKLAGVLLRGQYLVVHDDTRMAADWPCMSIYRGDSVEQGKLIVSYHCRRVVRDRSETFTMRTSRAGWSNIPEVTEIQFAGSPFAHQIP